MKKKPMRNHRGIDPADHWLVIIVASIAFVLGLILL